MPEPLPYGTWPSTLSAADLAAGSIVPSNLVAADDRLLWTEHRPAEGGRQALVAWDGAQVVELTPEGWNTRTRVHEYGGAPVMAGHGRILAVAFGDQRLYDVTGEEPHAITAAPARPAGVRWADGQLTPDGTTLIAVRETHEEDEVRNEVVAVDLASGTQEALVTGHDFVQAPRLSPDGTRLCWLAWDHPDMPWDGAQLWIGDLWGALTGRRQVAGGRGTSVCSPVWLDDGRLAYTEDRSGFWEVHVTDPATGATARVSSFGADVGVPAWQFGTQTIAPLPDGRLACAVTERAIQRLVLLDPTSGRTEDAPLEYSHVDRLRPFGDGVAFVGARSNGARAVVCWQPGQDPLEAATYDLPGLGDDDRAMPEPIEVSTPDGGHTHAFLYRPTNHRVRGPDDERPPLVVFTHGGPTGNVSPVLTSSIAYWTTRGFAVADVNYRGSTGYGRAYRDALRGRWGELDVVDTIAIARSLAANGVVDRDRMVIRGGSAGGYTTLAVLTTPDHPFAAGTSFFGVADLELLAEHTHKFESRYLDQMIGPLPEARDVYRRRSPLHRAHELSRPLLVLQGDEDEVVPPEQSRAMVDAAAAQGVPHAYLEFPGEQHGFRRAENIVTWLESELAFYGQVLGFTPAGDLPELKLSTG